MGSCAETEGVLKATATISFAASTKDICTQHDIEVLLLGVWILTQQHAWLLDILEHCAHSHDRPGNLLWCSFTESLATVDLLVNFKKQTAELQYLRFSSDHLVDGLFWGAQLAPIPKVNVTTNSLVEESKSSAACFAAFFSMRMDWQVFQIL